MTKQLQIPVKGMHCASCANIIERTLKKVPGVMSCEVNYGTEKAKFAYDESQVKLEELSKKIEPLGYSLNLSSQPENSIQSNSSIPISSSHKDHMMPDGTVMSGMDHSTHLGLNQTKEEKLKELKELKNKVSISLPLVVFSFIIMGWEIFASLGWVPMMSNTLKEFFHHLMPIFATYILFVTGKSYLEGIWRFIKHRVANMDTLVGIGTITAFIYSFVVSAFESELSKYIDVEHTYYDVVIVVIGLITFGKFLEVRSKLKTGEAIEKLVNLQAKAALVVRGNKEIEIPIEQVVLGDIIIIKPGSKIPVDGEIIEGKSSIDESMVTGEPIPVDKNIGDTVIGGTINKQGSFKFKATKVGSETLLSNIIKMVEQAQGSRAPIQKLADKISAVFVPVVLFIAITTLTAWLLVGPRYLPFEEALSIGLVSFVGILVIACPCAMGLATPTAIIVGVGKGANNGILIKNAESLEKLHKVNTIVVDKTGTITKGKPEVTDIISLSKLSESEILKITASLEKRSEHPLAEAILKKAAEQKLDLLDVKQFEILEGKGLKGLINNKQYYVGNIKLLNDLELNFDEQIIDDLTEKGKTPVALMSDENILAIIAIADTLKETTIQAVKDLHKLGIKVVMLTGDNKNTAKYIADQVGVDEVFAEILPNEKAEKIRELQSHGLTVAMAGDGVNDAPAIAKADVGIAMGTGTDVAIESSDITLLHGDISKISEAIKLSKMTMRTIKQNLFWAFIYNIIGIPLAAGLFYPLFGWLISPIFAGAAMAFSSVSVVGNSLRLKAKRL